jgi:hypothetical protein
MCGGKMKRLIRGVKKIYNWSHFESTFDAACVGITFGLTALLLLLVIISSLLLLIMRFPLVFVGVVGAGVLCIVGRCLYVVWREGK